MLMLPDPFIQKVCFCTDPHTQKGAPYYLLKGVPHSYSGGGLIGGCLRNNLYTYSLAGWNFLITDGPPLDRQPPSLSTSAFFDGDIYLPHYIRWGFWCYHRRHQNGEFQSSEEFIEDNLLIILAGGPGFEPGFTESESVVLPLDDPPV